MSIYTIDAGNTQIKVGKFENDILVEKQSFKVLDEFYLYYAQQKIDKSILSSVRNFEWDSRNGIAPLLLDQLTKLPFENRYKTKETLGNDRKALVSGAMKLFPKQNCLVIDAGTCITYDFINAAQCYLGGAISPGYTMRFKALNHYTAKLPLIEKTEDNVTLIGDSTNTSIKSGVYHGVLMELEGVMGQYLKKYSDLIVILTGGDAKHFEKQLKATIFAIPNLQMEGLYHILQQND